MLRLTIFLILLSISNLSAQDYRALAIDNATWLYKGYGEKSGLKGGLQILGDSTINNKNYKRLYKLKFEVDPPWTYDDNYVFLSKDLIGFLREDTIQKKIYGILTDINYYGWSTHDCDEYFYTNEEFLLHDFNIVIGDSLNVCTSTYDSNDKLKVLDIYYKDYFGYSFKTFQIDPSNEPYSIQLIEGLGFSSSPIIGVFQSITAGGGYGLTKYCRGIPLNECLPTKVIQIEKDKLAIFPNPAMHEFSIASFDQISKLRIVNAQGLLCRTIDQVQETIDVNFLTQGMYFLYVELKDGNSIIQKLIKQ